MVAPAVPSRTRELLLAVAVLGLIVTAVLNPRVRFQSLIFAVVGIGLLIRRRQRRTGK